MYVCHAYVGVGLSVEFARALFRVWLQEKDVQNVAAALKRAGLESKLMVGTQRDFLTFVFIMSNLSKLFSNNVQCMMSQNKMSL